MITTINEWKKHLEANKINENSLELHDTLADMLTNSLKNLGVEFISLIYNGVWSSYKND